jgi:NitT/TauT family transport system permease protein
MFRDIFTPVFTPNEIVKKPVAFTIIGLWIAVVLSFWAMADIAILPTPAEVTDGFTKVWLRGALIMMFKSLNTSLQAIFFAVTIGLSLVYLSTIPIFRPIVSVIGKLRFLSLSGVMIYFFFLTPNGHWLKVSVLTFSMLTFFINDMIRVVDSIPKSRFDHARTLGLKPWAVLWEVVVRGTLAEAFESLRMNAAIAWMMLVMVEGLSRAGNGIGVLLLSLDRQISNLPAILAIQIMILIFGIGQDALIKTAKHVVCPYSK